MQYGSPNARSASSKLTLCLVRLLAASMGSQAQRIEIPYLQNRIYAPNTFQHLIGSFQMQIANAVSRSMRVSGLARQE
jgi:hypothetical protein